MNLDKLSIDDMQSVRTNRASLRDILPAEPKWLLQVHGAQVVNADRLQRPWKRTPQSPGTRVRCAQ